LTSQSNHQFIFASNSASFAYLVQLLQAVCKIRHRVYHGQTDRQP